MKNLVNQIAARCRSVRAQSSPRQIAEGLAAWAETPLGGQMQSLETESLARALAATAGYRAMALRVAELGDRLVGAPQLHRFWLAENALGQEAAIVDFHALPLPSGMVDVVLLDHVLDYCELPHETLKEAARVVVPSGYLLLLGYNPLSLFGLARYLVRRFSPQVIWRCRGLSLPRIQDWLRLLGFQVERVVHGGYLLPVQSQAVLARLRWTEALGRKLHLPLGSFYLIVARKQRLRPLGGKREWLAKAVKPVKLLHEAVGESQKSETKECPKK